jgi:glycosyltransferase involved in cell wall biosynthesis
MDSGEFVWLPDIGYGNQGRWTQRLAVRATAALATRITVCTEYQARLASRHGVRAAVIPWGIDASRFPAAARADGPPWRLLQVASLNPVKDQRLLLDAFRLLVEAGIPAHLDLVGEDTLGGTIQHLAEERGVSRHVTFRGFLPSDALAPLYARSHLLVVSSRHEAAGVVALEAAACEVPAVGTAVGYLADWTPDRALTVAHHSADGLARAIREALADSGARARIAESARAWALAHDAAWTAARFTELYQDISGAHRASHR